MKCPTCSKVFHPQPDKLATYWTGEDKCVVRFRLQLCPSCNETIIIKDTGNGYEGSGGPKIYEGKIERSEIIYPQEKQLAVPEEVPDEYKIDLEESHSALLYSTKASAALSRRLLQKVLREKLGIKKKDLSLEIDKFIEESKAPSYLTGALDAVRQIGNFAAHPMKYTNTGEIVDVEPGEAEWLLEVLDSLFDFVFVQPARLNARREILNKKLKELGKQELKSGA